MTPKTGQSTRDADRNVQQIQKTKRLGGTVLLLS